MNNEFSLIIPKIFNTKNIKNTSIKYPNSNLYRDGVLTALFNKFSRNLSMLNFKLKFIIIL